MANILYRKQKQQKSLDNGVTWIDTGEFRVGDIIENPSNCTSDNTKQCRWVELPEGEGYYCDGVNKYNMAVEECSENGLIWSRTGNVRKGETLIAENTDGCGGWDDFNPYHFQCYLTNMKQATFPDEIEIDVTSNAYVDLENELFCFTQTNDGGLIILDVKTGERTILDGKWVLVPFLPINYTFGGANSFINHNYEYYISIYECIFIKNETNKQTFYRYTNGLQEIYTFSGNEYGGTYGTDLNAITKDYIYLRSSTWGVDTALRINKSSFECKQVATENVNGWTRIPTELKTTINGETYILRYEDENFKYYFSKENIYKSYLNGKEFNFKLHTTFKDVYYGLKKVSSNAWLDRLYIKDGVLYELKKDVPIYQDCLGNNTYINLSGSEQYSDLNGEEIIFNTNLFVQKITDRYLYSEKHNILVNAAYLNDVYKENGERISLNIQPWKLYNNLNHIWPNGIIEFIEKLDENGKIIGYENYLTTYNNLIKIVDDYLDAHPEELNGSNS
jgi:hypothetical protein